MSLPTLAKELREIQIQINLLPDPQSACQVIELLNARREHMFLILDVCLSSVLRETFLANGNENAYRVGFFVNLGPFSTVIFLVYLVSAAMFCVPSVYR